MKRGVLVLGIILTVILLGGIYFFYNENVADDTFLPTENNIKDFESGHLPTIVAAAFDDRDCPVTREASSLPAHYYRGPLIDTHIHIASIPDGDFNEILGENDHPVLGNNIRMSDYDCMMRVEDTKVLFSFFSVWEPIIDEQLLVVNETLQTYPHQFVAFIMPPDHDDRASGFPTVDAQTLTNMLEKSGGMFKGYGEIGLYERKKGGAAALPPDSARLKEIYPVVRAHNLVVYLHLGEGQKESFEKALEENPDITFIWHGDQLIQTEQGENLSYIADILEKYPNAYYGIDELYGGTWLIRPEVTKEEFLAHFTNQEELLTADLTHFKSFIEAHADQVIYGTDRGWSSPWSVDPDVALTLNNYSRAFIGRLEESVQEKFAYKNAEKIMGKISF